MNTSSSIIIVFIDIVVFFTYQFSSLLFASKILKQATSNKSLLAWVSISNTLLFSVLQYLVIPHFVMFGIYFFVLVAEFKLISKADFVQAGCCSSFFVLHFSTFFSISVILSSFALHIAPISFINSSRTFRIIIIILCASLTMYHLILTRVANFSSIRKATKISRYSITLLVSFLLAIVFQFIHSGLIFLEEPSEAHVLLAFTISISLLSAFYLLLRYSINIIKASHFKRNSDIAAQEKDTIYQQKINLIAKIEKDDLTGVFNRRYIFTKLEELCREKSNETNFYVLFVDVNGLKYTNDNFGHRVGDKLLVKVSQAMLSAVRECDIVARIGGDEFLVILSDLQKKDYDDVVSRILSNVENQNKLESFTISASIGSVLVDEGVRQKGVNHIIAVADEDMRKNKESYYKNKKKVST